MNKDDISVKSNEECSPIQELLNAHMQYFESLEYLKPNDFSHNPEKLLEKQIHYTISNMLKLQEYFQKSWSILGKTSKHTFPLITAPVAASTPQSLTESFPLNFSDEVLGRISNSIFTPTYIALNPFQIAESLASDLTTGMTTKQTKAATKKKTSKSKKK